MVKILKRCLLVDKKVLYKSPIDIAPLSSNLPAVNRQFYFGEITRMAISRRWNPQKKKIKKCSVNSHILTHSCQFMSQNVQYPSRENLQNFLTSQKSTLNSPPNGQSVTYSKMPTRVSRPP